MLRERWFVYVLRCGDGSLYTGIARDVDARLAQHRAGKGARYTRGRGPIELLTVRTCLSRRQALRLELAIKALPRDSKEELVRSRALLARLASRVSAKGRALAR